LADKLAFAWVGVSFSDLNSIISPYLVSQQNDVPFGYMDFKTNQPTQATVSYYIEKILYSALTSKSDSQTSLKRARYKLFTVMSLGGY
jgi:hypothetical protein